MTRGKNEVAEIEDKITQTKLPKEARERARYELRKVQALPAVHDHIIVGKDG